MVTSILCHLIYSVPQRRDFGADVFIFIDIHSNDIMGQLADAQCMPSLNVIEKSYR